MHFTVVWPLRLCRSPNIPPAYRQNSGFNFPFYSEWIWRKCRKSIEIERNSTNIRSRIETLDAYASGCIVSTVTLPFHSRNRFPFVEKLCANECSDGRFLRGSRDRRHRRRRCASGRPAPGIPLPHAVLRAVVRFVGAGRRAVNSRQAGFTALFRRRAFGSRQAMYARLQQAMASRPCRRDMFGVT